MRHISGTVHHLTIIFDTHMYNGDIARIFYYFFETLIFWAIRRAEGQKIAQNEN